MCAHRYFRLLTNHFALWTFAPGDIKTMVEPNLAARYSLLAPFLWAESSHPVS